MRPLPAYYLSFEDAVVSLMNSFMEQKMPTENTDMMYFEHHDIINGRRSLLDASWMQNNHSPSLRKHIAYFHTA